MSENTPPPTDDVVEALGKVLDIIDESYRKYGYDWDGEDTRAFQQARDLHQDALAAKPDQPAVNGLAEECYQLIAGGLNTTDKEWADWAKKNQTAILTALSSNIEEITRLRAENERYREAAATAAMYLATGFIECDRCGHEVETKHTDAEHELSQALQETGDEQR